jgi:hypothetical protein
MRFFVHFAESSIAAEAVPKGRDGWDVRRAIEVSSPPLNYVGFPSLYLITGSGSNASGVGD